MYGLETVMCLSVGMCSFVSCVLMLVGMFRLVNVMLCLILFLSFPLCQCQRSCSLICLMSWMNFDFCNVMISGYVIQLCKCDVDL